MSNYLAGLLTGLTVGVIFLFFRGEAPMLPPDMNLLLSYAVKYDKIDTDTYRMEVWERSDPKKLILYQYVYRKDLR